MIYPIKIETIKLLFRADSLIIIYCFETFDWIKRLTLKDTRVLSRNIRFVRFAILNSPDITNIIIGQATRDSEKAIHRYLNKIATTGILFITVLYRIALAATMTVYTSLPS